MENLPIKPKSKTFKDYYQDPDYKKNHLEYVMTKVECPQCGVMCSRCNLTKHKKSKKHRKHEEAIEKQNEMKASEFDKIHEAFLLFVQSYQNKIKLL